VTRHWCPGRAVPKQAVHSRGSRLCGRQLRQYAAGCVQGPQDSRAALSLSLSLVPGAWCLSLLFSRRCAGATRLKGAPSKAVCSMPVCSSVSLDVPAGPGRAESSVIRPNRSVSTRRDGVKGRRAWAGGAAQVDGERRHDALRVPHVAALGGGGDIGVCACPLLACTRWRR
jgi:hypothetical protein